MKIRISGRHGWVGLLGLCILFVGGCATSGGDTKDAAGSPKALTRAEVLHDRVLTVDTHNDWPGRKASRPEFDAGVRHEPGSPDAGQWDLPRMKEGGLDAVFFSIFTGQRELNREGRARAREAALEQIRIVEEMVEQYAEEAELARTPDDAYRIAGAGKRAIFLGMENGYPIGIDLGSLAEFHDLGIRYVTLCHTRNNDICDSSTDDSTLWGGLSPFGFRAVLEMNRLGIMVDVSHVDDETVRDVLSVTGAPVIASHSCVRSLCDHPRNLPDDLLRAIRESGGVIQVCLVGSFVKELPPNPDREAALETLRPEIDALRRGELTDEEAEAVREKYRAIDREHPRPKPEISDVADHIDYLVRWIGTDHVGVGTDFDGGGGVNGLDDVSHLPRLTEELIRRGYTDEEIEKIWGGNLMRVFREVIRVSEEMAREREG